jgi:hypothetical protein
MLGSMDLGLKVLRPFPAGVKIRLNSWLIFHGSPPHPPSAPLELPRDQESAFPKGQMRFIRLDSKWLAADGLFVFEQVVITGRLPCYSLFFIQVCWVLLKIAALLR